MYSEIGTNDDVFPYKLDRGIANSWRRVFHSNVNRISNIFLFPDASRFSVSKRRQIRGARRVTSSPDGTDRDLERRPN